MSYFGVIGSSKRTKKVFLQLALYCIKFENVVCYLLEEVTDRQTSLKGGRRYSDRQGDQSGGQTW
jgi:hypothetical protein